MLLGISVVLLAGFAAGKLAGKCRIPPILGMMAAGIIIGPYCLDLIDGTTLSISADIRKIALVIILAKAGLSLNISDLKKIGRPAVLMCFLPAVAEILGITLLAPHLLGLGTGEAALLGAVIASVSPAVVVPRMTRFIDEKIGTEKGVPQLILAGAAADDVFTIAMFTAFAGLLKSGGFSASSLLNVPISIISGIAAGAVLGVLFGMFFGRFHFRDSEKIIVFLGISLLLAAAESLLDGIFPFSGLIAVMSMGIAAKIRLPEAAPRMTVKLTKLWSAAEIMLFVLVGAAVDPAYAVSGGLGAVLLILGGLVFRAAGVFCCLIKTPLNAKERLFCMIAYMPKATVQAAMGGVPLAMGLACGETVLSEAVTAIFITAPLGAFGIDLTYKKLLENNNDE